MVAVVAVMAACPAAVANADERPGRRDEAALRRFAFGQAHMGCVFHITLYARDEQTAIRAATAAFARIAELDQIMSDYDPDSELMHVCRTARVNESVRISPDLARVLRISLDLSRRTDGAFDVTVGPLSRLWRQARKSRRLPEPARRSEALTRVGYRHVALDADSRELSLRRTGMQLDLGGIAKGFACDAALAILTRHGIRRALIDGGGDIVVGDAPPHRPGWRIGIASLKSPQAEPERYVQVQNAGVATSGDAFQHVEIAGTQYSHLVNPLTGLGLTTSSSVTVIAPDGTTADAWASALSVTGAEIGLPLLESAGNCEALIVRAEDEHHVRCETRGFAAFSVKHSTGHLDDRGVSQHRPTLESKPSK